MIVDAEIAWHRRRQFVDPTNPPALLKAAIDGISDVLWDSRDHHVLIGNITQVRGDGTVTIILRAPS